MRFVTTLERLRQGFAALGGHVYHYHRPDLQFPCVVWAEEGLNPLHADGDTVEGALRGTLDYFTPREIDPMIDAIPLRFREMGLAWSLLSVQFEDDTGLVHWEWAWEA